MKKIRWMFFTLFSFALHAQDNLDLHAWLQPVDSLNLLGAKDYYTWGASVVKGEDGQYHMFYSRWKHGVHFDLNDSLNYIFNGFKGWNKYSEIAYAVAEKLHGPYRHVTTVLKGSGDAGRWDRFTFHNPLIRKFDGWYYLYFISNNYDPQFELNRPTTPENLQWLRYNTTQKIGVVKAKTIHDMVQGRYIQAPTFLMAPDNQQTFEVATNPAVTQGPDGKYYMMYKSRRPNVGHMTFWMATADKPDGPFTTVSAVLNDPDLACEDPTLWYDAERKSFYAVAKYFSNAKKLAPQFGALVLLSSSDGLDWKPAAHPLVSLKQIAFTNGNVQPLHHLERPFVYLDEKGQPAALFAAISVGNPFGGDPLNVDADRNTFNVQIPLRRE